MTGFDSDHEISFLRVLTENTSNKSHMKLTYLEYNTLISEIKLASMKSKTKSNRDYYLLKNYELFECAQSTKLIKKEKM